MVRNAASWDPPFVVVVQSFSRVWLFVTPSTAACLASLSFTVSRSLIKCMSIVWVMPSNCLILSSPSPPTFNLSQHQGLFKWVSSSHQVAKLSVSAFASVFPMNIQDWFPLGWTGWISLQSKGLLRILSNTTIQKHQFFGVQLSLWSNSYNPLVTTGKTIALTRRTCVGKVMPLLFNMLSRLVIAFLPRGKHLLISCLQSPSAVILEPKKIKSLSVSIVLPSICHKVMGLDAMILVFWMLSFKPTFSLFFFHFHQEAL